MYLVGRISLVGRILMIRREMEAEHKLADDVRTSNMKIEKGGICKTDDDDDVPRMMRA